ncbi:26S proteasome non-ATPase regulatory subunit 12 homolog A-like [Salvia splendens]|uniref:26S proteasome non-ATPase regulatory subunit 12 homolog A-like n=1 Tax=Salvia splendens TaxID=180675 RepID=UPI001C256867|nr:26S proteasome non-ATPase regulatory subunit 12 homolog A-like [Salvia splendens]
MSQADGGGSLEAKIESLLNVEKQMRQVGDVAGTRKAATDIIMQLCYEAGAWQTLNQQILLISKRRGQLKQLSLKSLASQPPYPDCFVKGFFWTTVEA